MDTAKRDMIALLLIVSDYVTKLNKKTYLPSQAFNSPDGIVGFQTGDLELDVELYELNKYNSYDDICEKVT